MAKAGGIVPCLLYLIGLTSSAPARTRDLVRTYPWSWFAQSSGTIAEMVSAEQSPHRSALHSFSFNFPFIAVEVHLTRQPSLNCPFSKSRDPLFQQGAEWGRLVCVGLGQTAAARTGPTGNKQASRLLGLGRVLKSAFLARFQVVCHAHFDIDCQYLCDPLRLIPKDQTA